MSKKQKVVIESNDCIEELNGFVPVQYKIIKLDAKYILSCEKKAVPKAKGTGVVEYYNVPEPNGGLLDWLLLTHGNNGLVAVGDNILFQKIREVKLEIANEGKEIVEVIEKTPNQQQKEACAKLKQFRDEIKDLKHKINGNPTDERIENLNDTIYKMEQFLFVPEVINVESKKNEYDKFAKKGFFYGGHKFVRRSAGSGNLKQNTVTFVREDIEKRLRKKIRVGFQIDIETSEILPPSKFGAYEGLTTSGCIFVTKPRVVVIPDFEYITFKDKANKEHNVYYVTKDKGQNPPEYNIETVPFFETKKDEDGNPCAYLNSFDGMGFVSPSFIEEHWKKDLQIDYIPSTFIVRSIGVKGLLVTFPFKEFAKKKGYTHIVDVRYKGKNPDDVKFVDINDVDIILTESQWKYKKLYKDNSGKVGNNFDYYNNNPEALWGVQRYAPNVDKDVSRLNYQLVHTSNIRKDEDVRRVVDPTEKYLRLLAEGKPEYVMYALLKEVKMQKAESDSVEDDMTDDIFISDDDSDGEKSTDTNLDYEDLKTTTLNKAIFKNHDLLNDSYVSGQVKKIILSILNRAKCGKLYPEHNSNYQFMISDPYALAQWAFNWFDWMYYGVPESRKQVIKKIPKTQREEALSGIGLIPANHVYSKYWLDKQVSKVDACRSPMTDIAEHNVLNICNADNTEEDIFAEMKTYYRYIKSGIIYSLHDLSTVKHSDSDWDGDMVCTFDSDVFIENAWNVMPTTYDKGVDNMVAQKYDVGVAVESDKQGFGNKVGVYSNSSTSLFAMMPLFKDGKKHTDPNYPEYDCTEQQLELYKTVKKGRYIIGEEIDSTKTGVKPEMSKDFIFATHNLDKEDIRRYNQQEIEEYAKNFLEINELVPKYMPYFFIYVRNNYKDKYNAYKTKMNDACKWYTYESIDNFVSGVMHGTRKLVTKNEKFFWEYFTSHCPLLLTDCLMNKICWQLEIFESELDSIMKEKWVDNEKYVLMSYANEDVILSKKQEKYIKEKYEEYISVITSIYNKNNTDNGRTALYQVGKKDALLYKIRTDLIGELCVGYTDLFHMLVKALKKLGKSKYNSINSFIWNVMGDDILDVIPMNKRYLTWDDTKSADEEQGIEILGKNVVFTWREREI